MTLTLRQQVLSARWLLVSFTVQDLARAEHACQEAGASVCLSVSVSVSVFRFARRYTYSIGTHPSRKTPAIPLPEMLHP